ncbi:MAG TPA: HAD hydrolase-like protein [Prolixibacteraceae bacterium]|nr:HAD hydrolase-like protein [Prolixibacteraceae bacterium]
MKHFDTIIWDWNGTLLDDIDICIESINQLLSDRKLPEIGRQKYLDLFGFPVIDYYRRIGFDFQKEPFEIPAHQYIDLYTSKIKECNLQDFAIEVLTFFQNQGKRQMILSASELGILEESIDHFKIRDYFETFTGLDNHLATSKTELGQELFHNYQILPERACFIGDTTHDFEVASALGCECILVGNGHQSLKRLKETKATVVERLEMITSL